MYKSRLAWLAGMVVGLAAGATPIVGGAVYFYVLISKLFRGCEVFSDCMVAVSISPMVVFLMVCGAIMLRDILKGD